MNRLKKNIIYEYMLVSIVLVISSVFLYSVLAMYDFDKHYNEPFVSNTIGYFVISIIVAIIFIICAYWFYKRVDRHIKKEMDEQLKKQSQIFADIAHDIKNPMTAVLGLSRALEAGIVSKEEQNEVVYMITQKAKRIDKIINLMFQYAKMDSPEYKLNKKEFNISSAIKKLVAERYNEFEEKDMEINISISNDKVMVCLDELEILRVVDNLLNNVLIHNPNGTKVEVGLSEESNNLKIWIADSGKEISKEIEEKIFKPFVCEDESRNSRGGTGLGLAISRKIIEMHGGKIFIEKNFNGYKKAFIFCIKRGF